MSIWYAHRYSLMSYRGIYNLLLEVKLVDRARIRTCEAYSMNTCALNSCKHRVTRRFLWPLEYPSILTLILYHTILDLSRDFLTFCALYGDIIVIFGEMVSLERFELSTP